MNTFIHSVVPSKTIPDSRPKWAKCIQTKTTQKRTLPCWAAHTFMALVREYPPPPRPPAGSTMKFHSSFTFALSPCNVLRSLTSSVKGYLVKDGLVGVKKGARRREFIPTS